MKKICLLVLILLQVMMVSAQQFEVQKQKGQLFIIHTVAPKETLYSLGRTYHLTPKEIATANKLDANAGLQVGQQVKVPLSKSNFVQSSPGKKSGFKPVFHTVGSGDNLYRLSVEYNGVKQELLKKWNGLNNNVVKPGQEVVVGYLKYSGSSAVTAPVKSEPVAANNSEKAPTKVAVRPPSEPVITQESEEAAPVVVIQPEKKPEAAIAKPASPVKEEVFVANSNVGSEGHFAGAFGMKTAGAQPKNVMGMAATFKSTSGWNDGKYYILVNEIPAETIVKVIANGKTIYAKVLESLPGLKDNNGLVCRLSNAAASALGVTEAKFNVELVYHQ